MYLLISHHTGILISTFPCQTKLLTVLIMLQISSQNIIATAALFFAFMWNGAGIMVATIARIERNWNSQEGIIE